MNQAGSQDFDYYTQEDGSEFMGLSKELLAKEQSYRKKNKLLSTQVTKVLEQVEHVVV